MCLILKILNIYAKYSETSQLPAIVKFRRFFNLREYGILNGFAVFLRSSIVELDSSKKQKKTITNYESWSKLFEYPFWKIKKNIKYFFQTDLFECIKDICLVFCPLYFFENRDL